MSENSIAQDTEAKGYVRLKIVGYKKPLCRLDGSALYTNDTLLHLTTGKHNIKIWATTANLIDSSLIIKANDTVKYGFGLETSEAYIRYCYAHDVYKENRNKKLYISPIFIGMSIGAGLIIDKYYAQKYYNKAMNAKDAYERLGRQSDMDKQKSDFEKYKKKYNQMIAFEYCAYGLSAILVANYVRIIRKQRKVKAPVFNETKLLSKINFNVYPNLNAKTLEYGFVMKF